MKIKLDENLPLRLRDALVALGHDVDTVPAEGLTARPDHVVWQTAQVAGRFLITQDLDFSDARRYTPGTHHGILLVRLGSPGRESLLRRILSVFHLEDVSNWRGCIVILSDSKLRILHP